MKLAGKTSKLKIKPWISCSESILIDGQQPKPEFQKVKKRFLDQQVFRENSTKKGKRICRNYQEQSSKLRYKHLRTRRTTFRDIEKWK